MADNKLNISSLVSSSTLSNLKGSNIPKAFGDQIKNNKDKIVKATSESDLARLYQEKKDLIVEETSLEIRHQKTLLELEKEKQSENISSLAKEESLLPDEIAYIADNSWKTSTTPPDPEHGLRQCHATGYDTPSCNFIWDGYIHNYVSENLWVKKFGAVPDIVDGKDNKLLSSPEKINDNLTPEEKYQKAVEIENKNYEEEKASIQERKEKNQKDIDAILKDPFKKIKDERKKRKEARNKLKKRSKAEKRKARKIRIKNILKNASKNLAPVVIALLTDKIAEVVAQNDTIQRLVDSTNAIITEANESNDPLKLNIAKIARDNAIKVIQSNENKITNIRKTIQNISTYISIFGIIVNVLGPIILPIPTPSPAPDAITPPKERFRIKVYEPVVRILNDFNDYLPPVLSVFDKAIEILEDLKSQLLNVNGQLEIASAAGVPGLNGMTGTGVDFGSFSAEYKGFTFAIKEETGPNAIVVRGNKRHYAVAIDTNKVEVLKSESSFTLDPNDLVDQLKLVIDRENLIA